MAWYIMKDEHLSVVGTADEIRLCNLKFENTENIIH